jgi:DNA-binding transcriptional LysR family regulator
MRIRNVFLATNPFDLYQLQLFHLVAESRSFTKAGRKAGLTQSAITRQIQGMEHTLDVTLFERSTRVVNLTEAGRFLYQRSLGILKGVQDSIEQLQTQFNLAPPRIRIGISKTIGLAYLPGFLVQFRRKHPEVQTTVVQDDGRQILSLLEAGELDVGITCLARKPPGSLRVRHRFEDRFIGIAPASKMPRSTFHGKVGPQKMFKAFLTIPWLLINQSSDTGRSLLQWMHQHGFAMNLKEGNSRMDLDNFDLIVSLVGMGLGASVIPYRTLSSYSLKKAITRIPLRPTFTRQISIITRKHAPTSETVEQFLNTVLF